MKLFKTICLFLILSIFALEIFSYKNWQLYTIAILLGFIVGIDLFMVKIGKNL